MMTRDYAAPDWRGLCEELAGWIERSTRHYIQDPDVLIRARAALAQPEPEVVGPTDEELLELAQHHSVSYTMSDGSVVYPLQEGSDMRDDVLSFARAVLARYGRPAPAPAEGEVGELARWLRENADSAANADHHEPAELLTRAADLLERQAAPAPAGELLKEAAWLRNECSAENADGNWISMSIDQALDLASLLERQAAPAPAEGEVAELVDRLRRASDGASAMGWEQDSWVIARAADLLEQRHPTPVAVSERLPGPEDCDAEGRCWWWYPPVPEQNYGYWIYEDNAVPERSKLEWPDSWLPFHALPLPQGEVQP